MLIYFYVRREDPSGRIYQVNFCQRTWRVVGADPDEEISCGELEHDGRAFLSAQFEELEVRSIGRNGMTFYHAEPTAH